MRKHMLKIFLVFIAVNLFFVWTNCSQDIKKSDDKEIILQNPISNSSSDNCRTMNFHFLITENIPPKKDFLNMRWLYAMHLLQ